MTAICSIDGCGKPAITKVEAEVEIKTGDTDTGQKARLNPLCLGHIFAMQMDREVTIDE